MDTTDILIVGAGIGGLATAWWLGRERPDRKVVVLERAPRLGTGSSGRSAAILRTLGRDPVTSAIARASAGWLRAPETLGVDSLFEACGLVLAADGATAGEMRSWMAGDAQAAREAEVLDSRRARRVLAALQRTPELAVRFPGEGRIEVERLLGALARALRAGNVDLRAGTGVRALLVNGSTVEGVTLDDGRQVRAARTVLAAGGWAGGLGRRAGSRVELIPTRRHLLTTEGTPEVDPRGPVVWLEDIGLYTRPEEGGLLACACDTEPWDPECGQPFAVDPRQEGHIRAVASAALRTPLAPTARFWSGIRTLTSDERFVVGPDPDLSGLFWVAGLGGHGMTAGLEVGRLAARRLLGLEVDATIARALDPARLAPARA